MGFEPRAFRSRVQRSRPLNHPPKCLYLPQSSSETHKNVRYSQFRHAASIGARKKPLKARFGGQIWAQSEKPRILTKTVCLWANVTRVIVNRFRRGVSHSTRNWMLPAANFSRALQLAVLILLYFGEFRKNRKKIIFWWKNKNFQKSKKPILDNHAGYHISKFRPNRPTFAPLMTGQNFP